MLTGLLFCCAAFATWQARRPRCLAFLRLIAFCRNDFLLLFEGWMDDDGIVYNEMMDDDGWIGHR